MWAAWRCAAFAATAFTTPAAANPSYSLQRLPALGGSTGVPRIQAMNEFGQVVGGTSLNGGAVVPTLWAAGAAAQDLGHLTGQPREATAYGINNAGIDVGDAAFGHWDTHAFA